MGGVYSLKLSLWYFIGLHSKFMGDVEGDGLSQGVIRSTRNGSFGPRAKVDGAAEPLYPRSQKWQLDIGSGAAARDVIASAARMAQSPHIASSGTPGLAYQIHG